jgi:peptide/nickel transport system ATP-binding protein
MDKVRSASWDNGNTPLVSVRNLKTHFFTSEGVVKAVDGVSFDVYPGKTLGIVGESGCGKTVTALSVLRIVERPGRIVEGEILLRQATTDGRERLIDLAQLDEKGKEMHAIRGGNIALVFQEPMTSLSPVHTIGNQIVEAIRLHNPVSMSEAQVRAIEQLRSVGIPNPEQRVDEYSHQLSGGLRQRAMIAMALSCNPELLIADEPTTALDVTTQAQILDLLRRLQVERKMAIMLITHNLGVIAEMADEVTVMYMGKQVERAKVVDIFYEPRHPYTRALLRSIPKVGKKAGIRLASIEGMVPDPFNLPTGCVFHPRCPEFMPGKCDQIMPTSSHVAEHHWVSCLLYQEVPHG